MHVEPMLATPGSVLSGGQWAVEPKLDGWRAMVHVDDRVQVFTRRGRDVTARVPELSELAATVGRAMVLDGELVSGAGLPADFYLLGPRMASRWRTGGLAFVAFDLLSIDGASVMGRPYDERRALLSEALPGGPSWMVMPSFVDDPAEVFVTCVGFGLEGVVAKRRDSRYRPGVRSTSWVKVKAPGWRAEHGPRRHEP